jgi:hypothetical protein
MSGCVVEQRTKEVEVGITEAGSRFDADDAGVLLHVELGHRQAEVRALLAGGDDSLRSRQRCGKIVA